MTETANRIATEPWPSLEWASWIFDRASFVLIASLAVGVLATVAIVWMGIVKEHHWDLLREKSEDARIALEAKVAPRRLSGEQSAKMEEALAGAPLLPIVVVSRLFDPEGADFADDIAAVLRKKSWNVQRFSNWTESTRGVFIASTIETPLNDEVVPLESALDSAKIKYERRAIEEAAKARMSPNFQSRVLYLLVGAKP
ncbi:MAG: hypothetical protein HY242_07610 [Afipia sp.]|nr:hypothetical protein [Afipia sp.]